MAKYTINPKPVTKPRKDGQNQSYFEFTTEEGKTYNAPVKAKVTTPEGTVITLAEAQADANVRREFVEALVAEHYANVQKGIQAQADKLANMTDEEKVAYHEQQRQAGLKGAEISQAKFDALSDADKAAYKEQQRQAGLKGAEISQAKFDAMSDEAKAAYKEQQRQAGLKGAANSQAKFDAMSDEAKAAYKEQQRQAGLKGAAKSKAKFDAMSDEDKAAYKAEQSRQGKAHWDNLSPEAREAHRAKSIANNIQNVIEVSDSFELN